MSLGLGFVPSVACFSAWLQRGIVGGNCNGGEPLWV